MSRISVKVTPKASRDAIRGWLGETLKIAVTAAPEHGRANEAVETLLAHTLGVSAGRVRVVTGHGATRKQVEIDGLDGKELRARLAAAGAGSPV